MGMIGGTIGVTSEPQGRAGVAKPSGVLAERGQFQQAEVLASLPGADGGHGEVTQCSTDGGPAWLPSAAQTGA